MTTPTRTVLVTGGSRGLGLSIVRSLLDAGYRVACCSRNSSVVIEEMQAGDAQFFWCAARLGVEADEEAFVQRALDWSGEAEPYGLVNNAAIAVEGILASFPSIEIERVLSINLVAAMRITRLFLRHVLRRRSGARIVNISSIIGSRGYTGLAAYSASKAGMDGLTRSLARELGSRGITVNSIAPGYLETEMSARLGVRQREQIVNRTPLGRLGTAEDVVPLLRFLLSDEARFITGQTIVVDGGITC